MLYIIIVRIVSLTMLFLYCGLLRVSLEYNQKDARDRLSSWPREFTISRTNNIANNLLGGWLHNRINNPVQIECKESRLNYFYAGVCFDIRDPARTTQSLPKVPTNNNKADQHPLGFSPDKTRFTDLFDVCHILTYVRSLISLSMLFGFDDRSAYCSVTQTRPTMALVVVCSCAT